MKDTQVEAMLPDHCAKDLVILGCGNSLRGDDGFGPAVAARLDAEAIPEWAVVIDAGTGVRGILLDMLLCDRRPRVLVVVDAVDLRSDPETPGDFAREPGAVFELPLDMIQADECAVDVSAHQAPTSALLRSLRDATGVRVHLIVCQVSSAPDGPQTKMSPPVAEAVERASGWIADRFLRTANRHEPTRRNL